MESGSCSVCRALGLAAVLALAVGACAGDDGPSATYAVDNTAGAPTTRPASADPVPFDRAGPLPPGTYEADLGEFTLTVTLGEGWRLDLQRDYRLVLNHAAADIWDGAGLRFEVGQLDGGVVAIDPEGELTIEHRDNAATLPEDVASWFAGQPFVEPLSDEAVEVDGQPGRRLRAHIEGIDGGSGCNPFSTGGCRLWVLFGPAFPAALEAQEGSFMDNLFLETDPGPIVATAWAFDSDLVPEETLALLDIASSVVDSVEIHERVG